MKVSKWIHLNSGEESSRLTNFHFKSLDSPAIKWQQGSGACQKWWLGAGIERTRIFVLT